MQEQLQQMEATANEDESPLAIVPEKVCFIIMEGEGVRRQGRGDRARSRVKPSR